MNLRECYATLEIHENADKEKIRQAYRDLVTIWHPDRYQGNPRLQEKATEKLKELNTAYDMLMAHGPANRNHLPPRQEAPQKQADKNTGPWSRQSAAPLQKKHPFVVWIILLAAVAVTALALYHRWPFPLPGKTGQGLIASDRSSVHALAAYGFDTEQIVELQQALKLMGYDSGPADGKLGPKTIRAAQQFAMEFPVDREGNHAETLLAESSRQASIARVHTSWRTMARSREFQNWIDSQTVTSPDVCRDVLASGTVSQVVNLIDSYIFDREKPEPKELPPTGIIEKRFYRGMAPLKIKSRNEGRHFFVKLLELPEQKEVLSTFIRGGEMLKFRLPLGVYALKYAVGSTWYGTQWLFGSDTVYGRIEKDVAFTVEDNEISGYSIELYIKPMLLSKHARDYAFDF